MATQLSRKRAPEAPTIPDRLYFKIGDVARICGLETYVLRFWETQFPQLKPNKSGTGQRLYRRREVELVLHIKRLVHAEGYTLAGARQALEHHNRRPVPVEAKSELRPQAAPESAPQIVSKAKLDNPAAPPPPLSKVIQTPESDRRRDAAAAVIGHARAELRELAAMLASSSPRPVRRRPRLTTVPDQYNSLFPT